MGSGKVSNKRLREQIDPIVIGMTPIKSLKNQTLLVPVAHIRLGVLTPSEPKVN